MKKIILIVAVFTFSLAILASPLIENIRFSAPTIDDHIIVRGELSFFMTFLFTMLTMVSGNMRILSLSKIVLIVIKQNFLLQTTHH